MRVVSERVEASEWSEVERASGGKQARILISFTYCFFFKKTFNCEGSKILQLYDRLSEKPETSHDILF